MALVIGDYSQVNIYHYIQDTSILNLSYQGSRVYQLWSELEDIAIIIIILSPECQQPFLIKMASDNRLSAAVFGPKWLVTTGCQQPLPSILQGIQLKQLSGRTQSDRPCSLTQHHASTPEHEALPLSNKMCLQIVAVTFICSDKDG